MPSPLTGRTSAGVLAILAVLAAGLVSPAFGATSAGAVNGVVTLNGAPVKSATVQAYRLVYQEPTGDEELAAKPSRTDTTDGMGRFSLAGLPAKIARSSRYVVLVSDARGTIVKAFRTVVARKGRSVVQNVHVQAAAAVSGLVKTSDGRSPEGLTVGLDHGLYNDQGASFDKLYPEWETEVGPDGTFTLAGIPADGYGGVVVSDGSYASQCYDFVKGGLAACAAGDDRESRDSQSITLTSGERRSLPTVTASAFGPATTTISGRVTNFSGKALKGIQVRVASTTVVTGEGGRYVIRGRFPAGANRLRFLDPKRVWGTGGPDNMTIFAPSTLIIDPGRPITGLDQRLKAVSTAKISVSQGSGSATVVVRVSRKAASSAPGGTVTVTYAKTHSRPVALKGGKATVRLSGLPRGERTLYVAYGGNGSTTGFVKSLGIRVR